MWNKKDKALDLDPYESPYVCTSPLTCEACRTVHKECVRGPMKMRRPEYLAHYDAEKDPYAKGNPYHVGF